MEIQPLQTFINVECADGNKLPCSEYIENKNHSKQLVFQTTKKIFVYMYNT